MAYPPSNQTIFALALEAAQTYLKMAITKGPQAALEYTKNHPYRIAYVAVNAGAVMVMGPGGLVAVPIKLLGFGPLGPIAGSVATWWQASWFGGFVTAGSWFAWFQHLGMTLV